MTTEETFKFLMFVRASYPNWNNSASKQELSALCYSWHSHFEDVPVTAMLMAFHNYQKSNKFAPSIADMEEALKFLSILLLGERDNDKASVIIASIEAHRRGNKELLELLDNSNKLLGIGE